MYSEGPKLSFEDHLSKLDEPRKNLLQEIRSFVLSLGSNVIEEVRPHRIVYAKSFNFRTFLDIEPAINVLSVSVKMETRGTPKKFMINSREQLQNLRNMIHQAYIRI